MNNARATSHRGGRRLKLVVIGLIVVVVVLVVGVQIAQRAVRDHLSVVLGPNASWTLMDVGLTHVVVTDLSIRAEEGWPTATELSAKRVVVTSRLDSLLSRRPVVVSEMVVSDGVATMVRDHEGLAVLPVLLHAHGPAQVQVQPAVPRLWIEKIRFERVHVDFYDRTVSAKDFKIGLEPVAGTLGDIRVPVAGSTIALSFAGPVLGSTGNAAGSLSIAGTFSPHVGSDLQVSMQGVPIETLSPYLAKAGDTGIRSGLVDLAARSKVDEGKLDANGVLTLHDLAIRAEGGVTDTVLGLPRRAVIDSLKNRQGDVVLHFSITGDVHDAHFALNEAASTRISAGMAEALGLPIDNLAKGVGSIGEQGLNVAGQAASSVTDAVKGIFKH